MKIKHILKAAIAIIPIFIGCSKSGFLNEKPQKSMVIPSTLEHLQAILDRDDRMNGLDGQGMTPQLGESGADNFYLPDANYNTNLRPQMQNYYIWSGAPYAGVNVVDWEYPYRAILAANIVLESLESFDFNPTDIDQVDHIRGQALFHRAHVYYQLAQVFAPPYDINGDNEEPSIPLRLSGDINEPLKRSSVQETYDLITGHLLASIPLLNTDGLYKHRPTKQASYALLARAYLTMRDYGKAKLYADSCLAIQGELFDYNLADTTSNSPFATVGGIRHPVQMEIIFHARMLSAASQNYPTTFSYSLVDSNLYASYNHNDLRKSLYFQERPNGHRFVGSYTDSHFLWFSGLAVDEILLTRAEANIRNGNVAAGLKDLNLLLTYRWKAGTYQPHENLSTDDALSLVLEERRKELLYRGLRWSDLRRLNQEGYNISLFRNVNGIIYSLPPNDARWVWPFPDEVLIN